MTKKLIAKCLDLTETLYSGKQMELFITSYIRVKWKDYDNKYNSWILKDDTYYSGLRLISPPRASKFGLNKRLGTLTGGFLCSTI